jgi:hypothetical protein
MASFALDIASWTASISSIRPVAKSNCICSALATMEFVSSMTFKAALKKDEKGFSVSSPLRKISKFGEKGWIGANFGVVSTKAVIVDI